MKRAISKPFVNQHAGFILCALLAISIIVMCVFANRYSYFPGDLEIAAWLQAIDFPLFQPLMRAIDAMAYRLIAPLVVSLCALYLWAIRRRTEAVVIAVGFVPYGMGIFFKAAVDRPRPWELDPGLNPWLAASGSSFPSGHIMHFVLFYGMLLYLAPTLVKNRRARIMLQVFLGSLILLAAPAIICGARHWPSDVFAGYMVGGFFLVVLIWGYNRLKSGRFDRLLFILFSRFLREPRSQREEFPSVE